MKLMRWYDWMQYGILLLMAATVPVGWRLALWVALSMVTVTVVKLVAQRKVGNPALGRPQRVALYGPMVYWMILAVSLLWSDDKATGLELLHLKAVLLIFPFCILISDTTYLTPRHLRGIGYALLAGVVGAFLYYAARAGESALQGVEYLDFKKEFLNHNYNHHSYIALYAVAAMAFVYHELSTHWKELPWWRRGVLIASLPMLISYTVLVNSRAGMLALGLTAAACVIHLVISHRSWKLGLLTGLMIVAALVAATKLLPGYVDRLKATAENVEDDARTKINRANWHAYQKQPLVGYGAGDYHASQLEQYTEDGYKAGTKQGFNAHNQYMESLLAAGIPGLLALLFFLIAPLWAARRSRYLFLVVLLTFIVMFNLLFESMLERQMGLLFIGLLLPVIALIMSVEENKFGQLPEM